VDLESEQALFEFGQRGEIVGRQDFSLNDREIDLDLVEPTGVDGSVDEDRVGPFGAEAFDRIPLFRLAWDASISAFAGRQVLYERFFFGDPVRMAGALVTGHAAQIQEYADQVRAFVKEGKDEAFAAPSKP